LPRGRLFARRREWRNVARVLPQASVRVIRPGMICIPGVARPLSLLTFYRALRRLAREFQPDILVNYALSTGLPALSVARRHNIPFLLHVIDSLHTLVPSKILQPVARQAEKRLLRAADRTLYINHALQEYGVGLGARPQTASTIGSGVDFLVENSIPLERPWG